MIDAVVTGQSLPALQTALDLAEVGLSVTVLGSRARESAQAAQGASWAEYDPEGVVAAFMQRIAEPVAPADTGALAEATSAHVPGTGPGEDSGAAARRVDPHVESAARPRRVPPRAPLLYSEGQWSPQSTPNLLGVPAVPLAAETIALLGSAGAFRVYLDRLTPLLTVGKTRLFGELIEKRMGVKARTRLVDPQVYERFGVPADDVEAAIAAPGLNETLSRAGALSAAVLAYSDRNVARETRVRTDQGMAAFRDTLLHRLELYGVRVLDADLAQVDQEQDGWTVLTEAGDILQTRTLVIDIGDQPIAQPKFEVLVADLMPTEARVHADMDMQLPHGLIAPAKAVAIVGPWAIGIDAEVSANGAQGSVDLAVRAVSGVESIAEACDRLASLDGASELVLPESVELPGWLTGARPRNAELRAAPFRTVAARNRSSKSLADLETAHHDLMVVGRAVHGDDQGAALSAAHASAVRLRRRLLGLEE